MTRTNRRIFMLQLGSGTAALAAGQALAQARLDPKDPQATALGYVEDTAQADGKRFPNHAADQKCAGCQVYGGKPEDKLGPCAVFGGKLVAAGGWCSAWVKRA